jgi:NitT/TauT family transport system substrate-binding protein
MRALRTILTFASLLTLGLPATAVAEPTKVAIGYPPATDFLAAYVAKDQGIFAKHDIDAT